MAVNLGDNLRVVVRFGIIGARVIANHFFSQYIGIASLSDATAVSKLSDWMGDVYGPIEDVMDSGISLGLCQVDEVGVTGVYDPDPAVNDAKVVVIRTLGTFTFGFTPAAAGDQYAPQIAAVGVCNTALPKVRGRKSFGGLSETAAAEGVLNATGLTKLGTTTTEWLGGPSFHDVGTDWLAGVMSLREGDFVPFNGVGSVTNIMGNQVRRKLRRS